MGEDEADKEHRGSDVEGRARYADDGVGSDGSAEDVGEEARADKTRDAAQTVDGALKLALLGGTATSAYFAIAALQREKDAVQAQAGLEQTNKELEQAMARSLLRPLGLSRDGLVDTDDLLRM